MGKLESELELQKNFQKVKVSGVFMSNSGEEVTPVVLLENEASRVLPIYIGAAEAFSIQTAVDKLPYPRPLTHDLMVTVLEGLDTRIDKIMIDDLSDGIFFARIILHRNGSELEFDARPSDSIALAVRCGAAIYVANKVMEGASVDKKSYKFGGVTP